MSSLPRTLADVIATLSHLPDLQERTRLDLASAVRTFCKVTGLDPTTTLAGDLRALQARVAQSAPERFGLSSARWAVVRSQLLRALVLTGAAKPLRTATTRLSPGWAQLIAAIPLVRHRHALSRFGRFCTQKGVEPGSVTQGTFDGYRAALMGGSLVRNPATVYRDAARAWTQLPQGLTGCSGTRSRCHRPGPQSRRAAIPWRPSPRHSAMILRPLGAGA